VEATQAKLKFFICRTWSYTAFRLSEQVISVNPVKYVFLVDIQIDSKEEDIEFPTLGNYAVQAWQRFLRHRYGIDSESY